MNTSFKLQLVLWGRWRRGKARRKWRLSDGQEGPSEDVTNKLGPKGWKWARLQRYGGHLSRGNSSCKRPSERLCRKLKDNECCYSTENRTQARLERSERGGSCRMLNKKFKLYCKCSRKLPKSDKWGSDMIWFAFLRDPPDCCGENGLGRGKQGDLLQVITGYRQVIVVGLGLECGQWKWKGIEDQRSVTFGDGLDIDGMRNCQRTPGLWATGWYHFLKYRKNGRGIGLGENRESALDMSILSCLLDDQAEMPIGSLCACMGSI